MSEEKEVLQLVLEQLKYHECTRSTYNTVRAIIAIQKILETQSKREWQYLHEKEIDAAIPIGGHLELGPTGCQVLIKAQWLYDFAEAIEEKCREKNS